MVLLSSCNNISYPDSWYFSASNDYEFVKEKTRINSFSQLNNPIVMSLGMSNVKYLFGIEGWDSKVELDGKILVIIDTEKNKIYDWIYYPCNKGIWVCNPVNLGKNGQYFCDTGWNKGFIAILNSESGTISKLDYDNTSSLFYCPARSDFGFLYDLVNIDGKDEVQLDFVNLKTMSVENDYKMKFPSRFSGDNTKIIYGNNGNYFLTQSDGVYSYYYEIDINSKTPILIKKEELTTERALTNLSYADDEYCIFIYHSDYYQNINTNPENKEKAIKSILEVYDRKENKVIKTIEINYTKDNPSGITDIYEYNDKFYALVRNAELFIDDKPRIYEIDFNENTYSCLVTFNIQILSSKYFLGNKIYIFDETEDETFKYQYYDLETRQLSESIVLNYMDTIMGG